MGKNLSWLKVALLVKDTKISKEKLKQQVIVGTPGKLSDFLTKGKGVLQLGKVKVFVLGFAIFILLIN